MKLKYVGAKPVVSGRGVEFDESHPDSYTFLNAAVELLEALEGVKENETEVMLEISDEKTYNAATLLELLKKFCTNIEQVFATREEETGKLIDTYISQVKEKTNITEDERKAWLGNISIMRDYYLQYITNENAYKCALNAIVEKLYHSGIQSVTFPMGRNYGLVVSHLTPLFTSHVPPYDVTMSIEERNGFPNGKLEMNRPKPLNI